MTVQGLAGGEAIRCPLCSFTFEPTVACHAGCPLASHCHLLCCPNCGYQMVDAAQSRVAGWWRRLMARKPSKAQAAALAGSFKLSEAPLGVDVTVMALAGLAPQVQARLGVLGLLPGAVVQLVQRRPAPVVRVGETEIAVGVELLDGVGCQRIAVSDLPNHQ